MVKTKQSKRIIGLVGETGSGKEKAMEMKWKNTKINKRRKKMDEFKVKILGCTGDPQLISTAGALGCFEEESSSQIFEDLTGLPEDKRLKKEKVVLKNSFGRGHGSVGDQNYFIFSIEGLPRAATLQLCLPEYLAHLQQSLRRANASRGFYLPEAIKKSSLVTRTEEILSRSFKFYESGTQEGRLPAEDARFILPLYTRTNIQTGGDARELCHLWKMSQDKGVPPIVRAVVNEMLSQAKRIAPSLFEDFGFNYERLAWYPSVQLYALSNKMLQSLIKRYGRDKDVVLINHNATGLPITEKSIDKAVKYRDETELANLKHIHFEFLVSMSLVCFHQAIRQRTWNHSVESIYDAVDRGLTDKNSSIVTPPLVENSDFSLEYRGLHSKMIELYRQLVEDGVPQSEAIGVIPHSLRIYTLIHVNGWNAIHSIGKRTCLTAQWEIRKIAQKIAKIIKKEFPPLGKWAEPQCITYGKCPEIKDCGYYKKFHKKKL